MGKERLEDIIDSLPYSIKHEGNTEKLIEYAKEQAEQIKELEEENFNLSQITTMFEESEQQNKQYRNFIKTVSDPWEIARKIGKETDKNIIRADEVVGWIKREAERIMGEE